MDSQDLIEDEDALLRKRLEQARLEADLAYFQARLAFLGEPATPNQLGQRKAFWILHRLISSRLPSQAQRPPGR